MLGLFLWRSRREATTGVRYDGALPHRIGNGYGLDYFRAGVFQKRALDMR